jgi:hypothetical protein
MPSLHEQPDEAADKGLAGNNARALWLLLAAALAVNLGLLALYHLPAPKRLVGDEIYYFNLAAAIANRQPAQHDPLWPPLYAELIGVVFSWMGIHVLAVQIGQIALWLFTGYLFYRIVVQLFGDLLVATAALALYLFSPELMAFSHYLWPETLHLALMMAVLWLLICHPRPWWSAATAGILLGLAIATKSLLLPLLPALALFVLLVRSGGSTKRARALRAALLLGASTGAALLSLAVLPASRGEPSLAGSATFNAWVGLNDPAQADTLDVIVGQEYQQFLASGPDLAARNGVYIQKIRTLLNEQGLLATLIRQAGKQYLRLFDYRTFLTTQLLSGPRAAYAFDAPYLAVILRLYSAVFYALVLAAGALGMALVQGRPWSWLHFFLLFLAYNLAIFLVLHVVTRYMTPLLPVWMLFAAVALAGGARWLRRREVLRLPGITVSPMRLAAGATWAIIVSVLAFGSSLFWS